MNHIDLTIAVDWIVKPQPTKQTNIDCSLRSLVLQLKSSINKNNINYIFMQKSEKNNNRSFRNRTPTILEDSRLGFIESVHET